MSVLPIRLDRDDGEGAGREQLLAVHELRRDVERLAVSDPEVHTEPMALTKTALVRELLELIAALDRRVPHVERAGETSIASDAAALRAKAMQRVEELEREPASVAPRSP